MSLLEAERAQARTAVVDEHVRCENRHDLDATMATFGMDARYDDEPWGGSPHWPRRCAVVLHGAHERAARSGH